MTAHACGQPVHLVVRAQGVDAVADRLDHPGEVHAQHRRQRLPGMGGAACADLGVQRVDAARSDAHEHLPTGRLGPSDLAQNEGAIDLVHEEGAHLAVLHRITRAEYRRAGPFR